MRQNLLKLAASRVGRETLLVVDLTDVSKPHAREMGTDTARSSGWNGEAPR